MSSGATTTFTPPERILLGPGPSNVSPRVLAALARPTLGYLDPEYLGLLASLRQLLRWVFATDNPGTFAVSGPGTAAMECALVNLVEPGTPAVACVHGFFGDRLARILERCGARVEVVAARWGSPTEPDAVDAALRRAGPGAVLTVVHGETSTGVRQAIAPLVEVARRHDAFVVVDAVASLGGISVETDEWGVDVVYAAGQKCLGAAPGLSPITFGPRALERLRGRKEPCRSWFLDALSNLAYWDEPHGYHHTGPTHLAYALHEALLVLHEEGLRRRFVRTEQVARALWSGLEAMGLELLVPATHRLPTLTSVLVPAGVDETRVRARLLRGHGIEIAGGLGELRGRIWRIGLMGHSCSGRNVLLLLAALEHALQEQGVAPPVGRAVAAAAAALPQEETA